MLRRYALDELGRVYQANLVAPFALIQLLGGRLTAAGGTMVNVSSDAAVDAYPGWGGYGSSKAALDQLTAVLAAEEDELRCYAFDPGDMRTGIHQLAFPGEDISDRPDRRCFVPALLRLIDERPPGGRYRASDPLTKNPTDPRGGNAMRPSASKPRPKTGAWPATGSGCWWPRLTAWLMPHSPACRAT